MKSFSARCTVWILVFALFAVAAIEARNVKRADEWYREAALPRGCPRFCQDHGDCCTGYECWRFPARCIPPRPGQFGYCFPEQIQC
ncbi:hypothetical protein TrispH2_006371 [Trichoplax sp. H2]|nr:hypothetical protein TrispH2_006371 [Trichoplax sp. H2]|eukprot:RDD41507.1 hypothetical protein TrispH2_006371 [Trichoplax sp. H2]